MAGDAAMIGPGVQVLEDEVEVKRAVALNT
jgi:hypothetical protein